MFDSIKYYENKLKFLDNEISPTIFTFPTGKCWMTKGFAGDALPTAKLLASKKN